MPDPALTRPLLSLPFDTNKLLDLFQHFESLANKTSSDQEKRVCIGDVCITVYPSRHPEKIPLEYGGLDIYGRQRSEEDEEEEGEEREADEEILEHLQWMMQKDIMGQDIFLMGYVETNEIWSN